MFYLERYINDVRVVSFVGQNGFRSLFSNDIRKNFEYYFIMSIRRPALIAPYSYSYHLIHTDSYSRARLLLFRLVRNQPKLRHIFKHWDSLVIDAVYINEISKS